MNLDARQVFYQSIAYLSHLRQVSAQLNDPYVLSLIVRPNNFLNYVQPYFARHRVSSTRYNVR